MMLKTRKEAFNDDEVLQENVILLAEKSGKPKDIVLTTSVGRDLHDLQKHLGEYEKIIDNSGGDQIVRVATSQREHQIIATLERITGSFS